MKNKIEVATEHHQVMSVITPCPKPVHKKKGKRAKYISPRQLLEQKAESLSRELCQWLWPVCAFKQLDGARCGGGLQWSHIISRRKSPYLVYAIGNTVMGCSYHNGLDKWGDEYISVWYSGMFGAEAWRALWETARAHVKMKPTESELEEWIARYQFLLDDRPAFYTFPILVELGYYGKFGQ
jgi:hypothetical protein